VKGKGRSSGVPLSSESSSRWFLCYCLQLKGNNSGGGKKTKASRRRTESICRATLPKDDTRKIGRKGGGGQSMTGEERFYGQVTFKVKGKGRG